MLFLSRTVLGAALCFAGVTPAFPQQTDTVPLPEAVRAAYARETRDRSGAPGKRYWQIRPDYRLNARLDTTTAAIYGQGTLAFVNSSPTTLREIVLRLDQNRFRAERSRDVVTRGISIRRLAINNRQIDLTGPFVSGLTTTVVRITLNTPLQPEERLTVNVEWDYEVPLDDRGSALRQGRRGKDVFQIAQWYPRLAMFDDLAGWDVTEHDGTYEFYNPYARFYVAVQVPSDWMVGATGRLANSADILDPLALQRLRTASGSDTTVLIADHGERESTVLTRSLGDRVWIFEADSVSDFAWGASPRYAWAATSRSVSGARVLVHALMTRENRDSLLSALSTAANGIVTLSRRVMPYAWGEHTLLDGPEGGMEYPTLTMSHGDARTLHEISHQWFPMMVGSDETRFAFLDEGFASFFSSVAAEIAVARLGVERAALVPLVSGVDLRTQRPVLGYGRGSRMLQALAARFGEERLVSALAFYAKNWRFKHPSPWDFMASVEAALGEDLDSFWLQWLFSSSEIKQ